MGQRLSGLDLAMEMVGWRRQSPPGASSSATALLHMGLQHPTWAEWLSMLYREEHSMDQCRSRLKLSENFERHWSMLISGEIHMDQSLVHTFSWGNLYGPMVLKVREKFPPTLVVVHGWLFPVVGECSKPLNSDPHLHLPPIQNLLYQLSVHFLKKSGYSKSQGFGDIFPAFS